MTFNLVGYILALVLAYMSPIYAVIFLLSLNFFSRTDTNDYSTLMAYFFLTLVMAFIRKLHVDSEVENG